MEYKDIIVEQKEHLTIVTINRPNVMNAINPMTSLELEHVFDAFNEDPEAWVCIITGAGERGFCVGNDLKFHAENMAKMAELNAKLKCGFGGITERYDCFKPIIAAVNGMALGGGFEIALSCDIIIASENAAFGLPEPRVGLMALAGGVHRLSRQIPYHTAMGMILGAKRITPHQALSYGIVNEVVAPEKLMETAENWANEIMLGAPLSLRASKEAVIKGADLPLDKAVAAYFPGTLKMMNSEDMIEGPTAFAQKRKPNWKGR
ncbi:MAG: enoyl-CoA hydratase-related protein [Desulfobacterales bacterium]